MFDICSLWSDLNAAGVHPPHLEAVIHAARDDLRAVHVEVCAEDLVTVALHPAEDGDVVLGLHVPQPQGVVLRHGQQQVGVLWMELQLVDRVSVSHKMPENTQMQSQHS